MMFSNDMDCVQAGSWRQAESCGVGVVDRRHHVCGEEAGWGYGVLLSVLSFAYTYCAIGFQGVPTLSRSAVLCGVCLMLALLEGVRSGRIVLEPWLVFPLGFCLYIILTALRPRVFPVDTLYAFLSTWGGSIAVGIALRHGVSWRIPVYAMLLAGLTSVGAHLMGINSIVWSVNYEGEASLRRATGLMGNANTLAICLGMPAFLILMVPREFSVGVKVFSLILSVYGAIISASRKGLVLALCLVSYVLLSTILKGGRFRYAYVLILALVVMAGIPLAMEVLLASAGDVPVIRRAQRALEGREESAMLRLELMRVGSELFWRRPVLGYGLGMFAHVSGMGMYAHNNYCELAVNGGVLAIVLYYCMHCIVLVHSRHMPEAVRQWVRIAVAYILLQDLAIVSYTGKMTVLVLMMLLVYTYPLRRQFGTDKIPVD
ncbi:MAG: O-antigen ligase family protein [Sedimentisphaerales bacterium]|jgi:hypothetical protein|nr:O-antigen ligase family protein [Sedimentisphaerales bacterium]